MSFFHFFCKINDVNQKDIINFNLLSTSNTILIYIKDQMDEEQSSFQYSQFYQRGFNFNTPEPGLNLLDFFSNSSNQFQEEHHENPPAVPVEYFQFSNNQSAPFSHQSTMTHQSINIENSSENNTRSRGHRVTRQKRINGNQGTRNMLPFFWKCHIQFYKKYKKTHPAECEAIERNTKLIQIFSSNKSANRIDFQQLYTIVELTNCWKSMFFEQKYLNRYLLTAKPKMSQRCTYLRKIDCFVNAFKTGRFEYIN